MAWLKPSYYRAAQAQQLSALAITDQMNLCGLVRFYGAAHGAGIKPIVGADIWLNSPEFPDEPCRLVVLAKNNEGYNNLTLLISKAYLRGHVMHRAMVDRQWLAEHSEGLILLSGGKDGDLGKALLKGNAGVIEEISQFYRQHFAGNFYLELMRTGRADEESYLHLAVEHATHGYVVATVMVFLEQQDFEPHEILVHDGYTLEDKRPRSASPANSI